LSLIRVLKWAWREPEYSLNGAWREPEEGLSRTFVFKAGDDEKEALTNYASTWASY
jgi:hypothetical protein